MSEQRAQFLLHKIVTQRQIDMKKDCRAMCGDYVEASTLTQWSQMTWHHAHIHGCIALGPSGNLLHAGIIEVL